MSFLLVDLPCRFAQLDGSVQFSCRHDEFWRVEEAMTKILGLKPKYFRPPYGKYNDQVLQVAAQRGYTKMILWSDDTRDASGELLSSSTFDRCAFWTSK